MCHRQLSSAETDHFGTRPDHVRGAAADAAASIFSPISADMRASLVQIIATESIRLQESGSSPLARCLRKLPLDATILCNGLAHFRAGLVQGSSSAPPNKKPRRSEALSLGENSAALAFSELLAVAYERKTPLNSSLTSELFEDVRIIAEMRTARLFNIELSLYHALATLDNGLSVEGQRQSELTQSIRVDVLVAIVKLPLSRSLLHNVLSLLGKIATIAPEHVVHNVMPILTFVGSSVLSRDDQASFAIVELTIRDIVTSLVKSIRKESADTDPFRLLLRCRDFLRVFTGAAHHIPRHRRSAVFQLLVDAMGASEFLGAVCLLLVDRYTNKILKAGFSEARDGPLELPLALFSRYDGVMQGRALIQCLEEASRLLSLGEFNPVVKSGSIFLDRLADSSAEHGSTTQNGPRQAAAVLEFVAWALQSASLQDDLMRQVAKTSLAFCASDDARVQLHGQHLLSNAMDMMKSSTFVEFVGTLLEDSEVSFELFRMMVPVSDPNFLHQGTHGRGSSATQQAGKGRPFRPICCLSAARQCDGSFSIDCPRRKPHRPCRAIHPFRDHHCRRTPTLVWRHRLSAAAQRNAKHLD